MPSPVLLAYNKPIKFKDLEYPMLGSPKYDGNRLIIRYGELLSRKLKPQKNTVLPKFLEEIVDYSRTCRVVFDGEFYSHDHHFCDIQSMRAFKWTPPKGFHYHVFDMLNKAEWESEDREDTYDLIMRVRRYQRIISEHQFPNVIAVRQSVVHDAIAAAVMYAELLQTGYEGLILRDPQGHYKHGRSTLREGLMFKFKKFATVEGKITGFDQRTRLTDEYRTSNRGTNPDGSKERSGKQEHRELVPDTIGAVNVQFKNGRNCNATLKRGVSYESLGITWKNRRRFIGRYVEIEYQEAGTKDRPRMPRIIRLRPDLD